MIINPLVATPAAANDPSFMQDLNTAIAILDATFTANVSVNIEIEEGTFEGQTLPKQTISEGNFNKGYSQTYTQLRADLINASDPGFFNNASLPNTTAINGISSFWISSTQARIFGVLPAADANNIDGFVGIGFNFNPGAERISGFLHEIGHALARVNLNLPVNGTPQFYSNLDLWRFTSPGTHDFDGTTSPPQQGVTPAYFSLDGGVTKVADWGVYSDPSDFLNPQGTGLPPPYSNLTPNDPFNEFVGNLGSLTNTDLLIMDALGFRHTRPGAVPVIGAGDFNNNGSPDFIWNDNSFVSMWEYNPAAQAVSNTALASVPGWATLGSAHFSNANGASASSTQMLMDYVPNGTMTLWWVTNGGAP